ncbi:hypothetical protein AOLI_G00230470 [Acnodon oligacanthus]
MHIQAKLQLDLWKNQSSKKQENFNLAPGIQRVSRHLKMYWFLCFILLMGVGDSTTQETPQTTATGTAMPDIEIQTSPTAIVALSSQPITTTTTQQTSASGIKTKSTSLQIPTRPKNTSVEGNKICFLLNQEMNPKLILLIIGALSVACIILLTATLLLACKVCCPKRQVLDTTQSTSRRLSVDDESALMINEISKPEGDENHSGPEEPEKPIEEAAEATEVSNQASIEDPTLCVMSADDSPPNQECEMSEKIILDDAEQP